MAKIKIPKSFQLFGRTIDVKQVDTLFEETGWVGEANYRSQTVRLQKSGKNFNLSEDMIEHTFFHELVHHILHSLGEIELSENERFVDTFGALLHQYHKTSKY